MTRLVSLIVIFAAAIGCQRGPRADYSKLDLLDVSGRVTLDGQPLEHATIRFEDVADGTSSYGVTDADGHYVMMLNSEKSGVMAGKKIVRITSLPTIESAGEGGNAAEDGEELEEQSAPPSAKKELVPAVYNGKSQLMFEVTDSDSGVDFELKSDGSTKTAS